MTRKVHLLGLYPALIISAIFELARLDDNILYYRPPLVEGYSALDFKGLFVVLVVVRLVAGVGGEWCFWRLEKLELGEAEGVDSGALGEVSEVGQGFSVEFNKLQSFITTFYTPASVIYLVFLLTFSYEAEKTPLILSGLRKGLFLWEGSFDVFLFFVGFEIVGFMARGCFGVGDALDSSMTLTVNSLVIQAALIFKAMFTMNPLSGEGGGLGGEDDVFGSAFVLLTLLGVCGAVLYRMWKVRKQE